MTETAAIDPVRRQACLSPAIRQGRDRQRVGISAAS